MHLLPTLVTIACLGLVAEVTQGVGKCPQQPLAHNAFILSGGIGGHLQLA